MLVIEIVDTFNEQLQSRFPVNDTFTVSCDGSTGDKLDQHKLRVSFW